MSLHWLAKDSPPDDFPDVELALDDPPGLLAAGGDLKPERLIAAYSRGIFPWYEAGQPILWWCPDPRAVLFPDDLHVSRTLQRTLQRGHFHTSIDQDFDSVVTGCAAARPGQRGTWITPAMVAAYGELFHRGIAHSVEVWHEEQLAGGIYGLSLGRVFYGESMFGRVDDASKVGLVGLVQRLRSWKYELIDCQIHSAHLRSLGSTLIPRRRFIELNTRLCSEQPAADAWQEDPGKITS